MSSDDLPENHGGDEQARTRVPVLVSGGGPVGLTTALELAFHGIPCLVVEPRTKVEHSRPRAKTVSVRSMELLRRTGAAAEIRRRAPLPVSWSSDIRFCWNVVGTEITRITEALGLDLTGTDVCSEAGQQITQPLVEEVLRDLAGRSGLIDVVYGSRVSGLDLSGPLPRAVVTDAQGRGTTVEADYVVGADGGHRSRTGDRPSQEHLPPS